MRGVLFFAVVFCYMLWPRVNSVGEEVVSAPEEKGLSVTTNTADQELDFTRLTIDELRLKLAEIEESIPQEAEKAQELSRELRELRIAGQQSDPAKAVREEMAALQRKLEQVIDELPEVKAKAQELTDAKARLFKTMQLRTKLMTLIAAAERGLPMRAVDTVNEVMTTPDKE